MAQITQLIVKYGDFSSYIRVSHSHQIVLWGGYKLILIRYLWEKKIFEVYYGALLNSIDGFKNVWSLFNICQLKCGGVR